MNARPLGKVKEIIQTAGLQMSYTYDDLIFIEDNPLLIQFDDINHKNLKLRFNTDCNADEVAKLEAKLESGAEELGFTIQNSGKFKMQSKKDSEELEIKFL